MMRDFNFRMNAAFWQNESECKIRLLFQFCKIPDENETVNKLIFEMRRKNRKNLNLHYNFIFLFDSP